MRGMRGGGVSQRSRHGSWKAWRLSRALTCQTILPPAVTPQPTHPFTPLLTPTPQLPCSPHQWEHWIPEDTANPQLARFFYTLGRRAVQVASGDDAPPYKVNSGGWGTRCCTPAAANGPPIIAIMVIASPPPASPCCCCAVAG